MTSRTQQRRTTTVNGAPANNSLAPGELYVEEADPAKLWVGVATSVSASGIKKLVDAGTIGNALLKTGDTASGLMTFNGGISVTATPANVPLAPPDTNTLQAASTSFVLGQAATTAPLQPGTASAGAATRWSRGDHVHPATAPTPAPSDNSTAIATTAFVVNQLANSNALVYIGDTPPTAIDRLLWWSSSDGVLYVRYNDGNTTQWVPASPSAVGQYLPLTGGTLTGPLTLSGNAASALQAAPLQQVVPRTGRASVSTFLSGVTATTTSSTENMAGIGGYPFQLTPQVSGTVIFCFQMECSNPTAGAANWLTLRYGTGTAPSPGAAATGTAFAQEGMVFNGATHAVTRIGLVTGAAIGTGLWFDLGRQCNGGTFNIGSINCWAVEL